ncbi:conserved protein of unknown function [Tenacibaculum sp. 190130A14a]|uniref:Uncharacterized protein n=1 Tax=Tenacibaculum polynesiense TaxID=3137857 RepID=A0ABM9PG28_9FLAO
MNINVNSPESIIFPPGIEIDNQVKVIESGNIIFNNNFDKPLPSLVEASYDDIEKSITVNVLFFVNSYQELTSVSVHQLFSISNFGHGKLQFFLSCADEAQAQLLKDAPSGFEYQAYTAEFTTRLTEGFPEHIDMCDIKVVQTFVWDIDPKTSRGTETTVQTTD